MMDGASDRVAGIARTTAAAGTLNKSKKGAKSSEVRNACFDGVDVKSYNETVGRAEVCRNSKASMGRPAILRRVLTDDRVTVISQKRKTKQSIRI